MTYGIWINKALLKVSLSLFSLSLSLSLSLSIAGLAGPQQGPLCESHISHSRLHSSGLYPLRSQAPAEHTG